MKARSSLLILFLAGVMLGCGGGGNSTPQTPSPYSARITGPSSVVVGNVAYASNFPQSGASFAWAMSGPGSGYVTGSYSESWRFTANAPGTLVITLSVTGTEPGGNVPAIGTLSVTAVAAGGNIRLSSPSPSPGNTIIVVPTFEGDSPELYWQDEEGNTGQLNIDHSGDEIPFIPRAKTTFSLRFQNVDGQRVGNDRFLEFLQ